MPSWNTLILRLSDNDSTAGCCLLQMFAAKEGGAGSHDSQQAASQRKQLVFELNRSGQYLRLKEQLKAGVVGIVKESYHKSGGMGRQEMQASCAKAP